MKVIAAVATKYDTLKLATFLVSKCPCITLLILHAPFIYFKHKAVVQALLLKHLDTQTSQEKVIFKKQDALTYHQCKPDLTFSTISL